jgi:hypothetical protein
MPAGSSCILIPVGTMSGVEWEARPLAGAFHVGSKQLLKTLAHSSDEETEAQSDKVTCLWPHNAQVTCHSSWMCKPPSCLAFPAGGGAALLAAFWVELNCPGDPVLGVKGQQRS